MTLTRWTEQAVEDLRSIRAFIERDSPRYGRLVAERLFDATEQIVSSRRPVASYRISGRNSSGS